MGTRIAVTGGRNYSDVHKVAKVLSVMRPDAVLVNGGAPGADYLCAQAWRTMGRSTVTFNADWALNGKAAGVIRNDQMARSGLDLLIAFPGGRGTSDMVKRCREAGIPVLEVS